mmetsp:Transcript_2305/g.9023  ORF Transcript_2305/g.9023 Transcript_2305/m.9023 type:complete len:219 (-) Transcript_2305:494-1150(-)
MASSSGWMCKSFMLYKPTSAAASDLGRITGQPAAIDRAMLLHRGMQRIELQAVLCGSRRLRPMPPAEASEIPEARHGLVVEEPIAGPVLEGELRVEEVVHHPVHRLPDVVLLEEGLRDGRSHIVAQNAAQRVGHKGLVATEAKALHRRCASLHWDELSVTDPFAKSRPRDVADLRDVIETTHLLLGLVLQRAVLPHGGLLGLPDLLVHLAALAPPHEV